MEMIPRARLDELLAFMEKESQEYLRVAAVQPGSTPEDITPLQMGYINSASGYLAAAAKIKLILKGK